MLPLEQKAQFKREAHTKRTTPALTCFIQNLTISLFHQQLQCNLNTVHVIIIKALVFYSKPLPHGSKLGYETTNTKWLLNVCTITDREDVEEL